MIVPPVMLHVLVIPACGVTDAVFPVEVPHTALGAVITGAEGALLTSIAREADALASQLSVAVTVSVKLPEAGAVYVMESPVVAEVIVPPVIVHTWVTSARGVTDAVLPVENGQTVSSASITGGVRRGQYGDPPAKVMLLGRARPSSAP